MAAVTVLVMMPVEVTWWLNVTLAERMCSEHWQSLANFIKKKRAGPGQPWASLSLAMAPGPQGRPGSCPGPQGPGPDLSQSKTYQRAKQLYPVAKY